MKTHAIIFGINGFKLNLKEINFFKKYKPWGIILFSRNINNLDQVRNLTSSIRELFKDKNFPILIDQEGGKVNRFRKIINLDKYNAKYFGDIYKNNKEFYSKFSKFLKINISILKYCGININTVPVLDLFNEDKKSVIGNRAFSKKFNIVIKLSKYLINSYKNSGLGTIIKHIPGHGCTNIDSHFHLPKVSFSLDYLKKNDFVLCGGSKIKSNFYLETLPNGKSYVAAYAEKNSSKDTDVYSIPQNKFFFMGDNRDCSQDSRYLTSVGYVDKLNLVGKAQILFFSNNEEIGNLFTFWKWHESIRFNRVLKFIK